jgi:uncharacterized protein (TIGR03435 family)
MCERNIFVTFRGIIDGVMRKTTAILMVLMTGAAFGQDQPAGARFVAADIHTSAKDAFDFGNNLAPGNRVTLRGATMTRLIELAYGVPENHVVDGPKWVDVDKFDVLAKPPAAAKLPELQAMMQTLLAERFQLKVKKEERKFPVYVFTAAKTGLKLKPSKSKTEGDCVHPDDNSVNRICTGLTIEELGQHLRIYASGYFDREVLDRTSATGRYDFTLKWSGKGLLGHSPDAISLYDVLEKQYGIKTDQDTMPMPVIAVESVNQTPSPNPPGTTELLPPMPTEFEVAVLKINKDPQQRQNFRFANGRVDATGLPLKPIIGFAYGIDEDMIVGAQPWMDTELFDLTAKTDPGMDLTGMQPMLQKLLEERFHLKVHREDRPVEVYALTAAKGVKLTPGDPSARGGCKVSVENGLRTYTCQNTTLAEFAEKVRGVAAGYLDRPVVDLTGLKGAYNFAVSWNGVNVTRPQSGRGGDAAASGVPSDPGSGITFFKGLEKIGLKAAKEKHPMPVLVIDKADRAPTEN